MCGRNNRTGFSRKLHYKYKSVITQASIFGCSCLLHLWPHAEDASQLCPGHGQINAGRMLGIQQPEGPLDVKAVFEKANILQLLEGELLMRHLILGCEVTREKTMEFCSIVVPFKQQVSEKALKYGTPKPSVMNPRGKNFQQIIWSAMGRPCGGEKPHQQRGECILPAHLPQNGASLPHSSISPPGCLFKGFSSSYYNKETMFFTIDLHYGNFN